MKKLYLSDNWNRRGSALWIISNGLRHFFGVETLNYHGQSDGTLLSYDIIPKNAHRKIKKILLVGGFKLKDNGVPRNENWNNVDSVVFNSKFFQRIVLSKYNIKNSSVIYILGGAPSEENMFIPRVHGNKIINNEINFVACAKWWKRPFKRLAQTICLFKKYITDKYPKSKLHVLGCNIPNDICNDRICYYRKTFHKDTVPKILSNSHMQILLTPFDSGPLTLTESLHYRVPFVCSSNCCGPEIMEMIVGKCGETVNIDSDIKSAKQCLRTKPITDKNHYGKKLDYELIMSKIITIVDNYEEYTSWSWSERFNYECEFRKWHDLI